MKLTIAFISTLAAFASADYLEQNTLCGDNKACEGNCQDGRYHIVSDDTNSIHFGCSFAPNPKPVTYANPDCSFGLGDGPEETANARATCDTVGGTLCRGEYKLEPKFVNKCVMLNKDAAAFKENCEAAGGTARDNNSDFGSYEILVDNCK
jgi:hypothetical protein